MTLKLTLLLTAAVVSSASAVEASAVERANILVAQQQQQNENAQERREKREERKQQRQEERQQQKQEKRQQAPNNAQNQQQQQKQQPASNQDDKRRQENRAGNQDRKPAQDTQSAPKPRDTQRDTSAPKADNQKTKREDKPADKDAASERRKDNDAQDKRGGAKEQATTPAQQKNDATRTNAAEPPKPSDNRATRDSGPKRLEAVKAERKETKEGNRTIIKENNRTIIKENNTTIIRHDDTERYRRVGGNVQVQRRGNLTENVIVRPGGVRIVERFDERGRLIRRSRFINGREVVLISNRYRPGADFTFIVRLPPPVVRIPRERYIVEYRQAPRAWIYETLIAPPVEPISQRFTLDEIRYNAVVRERMPRIDIDTINFETGSWDVTPDQAQLLGPIAEAMRQAIEKNPEEVYLVEGHTDAVGATEDNLSLSDRRAEAVAEVLTTQFNVPPENLVTQGYGEQNLKVETQGPEPRNRYVTVRRITPLLAQGDAKAPQQ
jgi:outer membrane protein OmpA-like peptidoglycan-associated protein